MKKSNKKSISKDSYDSKIHDKSAKEIFSKGLFLEDFCEEHDICRATFYNWLKNNPSFKEAVEKGKSNGEAKWVKIPLKYQQKTFSYPYWSAVMKHKYNWGHAKVDSITGKETPLELIGKTIMLYASGELKDNQVEKLISMATAKIKAIECDSHEERLQRLEKNSGIS